MNPELTMQVMFDTYPQLFKDRSDCLNQLFCVIGNGYDWVNGELVDIFSEELPKNPLKDGKAFQYNLLSLRDESRLYIEKYQRRIGSRKTFSSDEELEEYLNTIPNDKYHRYPREQRWYFYRGGLCKDFAYLFNYPDNITEEWKSVLEECCQMLIEDGYDI